MKRYLTVVLCIFLWLCYDRAGATPKTMFQETLTKAQAGDAQAQFEVAAAYESGDGIKKNIPEAINWYKKSAGQGNALAQSTLGYIYLYGQGIAKNPQEALFWNRKAAEQGDSYGELNLAVMLDEGIDVPEDNKQAVEWYWKAARQGLPNAQLNLGVMYFKGEGVERDLKQAWELLNNVRVMTTDKDIRWKAVSVLDKIKDELGADQGRFAYPEWGELQKYIKQGKSSSSGGTSLNSAGAGEDQ